MAYMKYSMWISRRERDREGQSKNKLRYIYICVFICLCVCKRGIERDREGIGVKEQP